MAQRQGKYNYLFETRIKNRFICSYCGKEVVAPKRKKRNGEIADHIFCNRECYDKFRRLDTDRVCKYCGKHFIAIRDKKRAQFCNDNCRRAYFTQQALVYCANCGQAFYQWSVDKIRGTIVIDSEIKCCCDKCSKEYHKRNEMIRREKISFAFTGAKHPNWQGGQNQYRGENWTHQKFLTKKRDNYTCQCCGISEKQAKKKYGNGLEVHHKKPYLFFNNDYLKANDLSNLITLCKSCHQKTEWEYRKEHESEYQKYKTKKN